MILAQLSCACRDCWIDANGLANASIHEKYAWSVLKALSETIAAGLAFASLASLCVVHGRLQQQHHCIGELDLRNTLFLATKYKLLLAQDSWAGPA